MSAKASVKKEDFYPEVEAAFGRVPEWFRQMPSSAGGFWELQRDLELGETKIPNKYKELIGLAVSGATRCRYCALFHTEAARLFGATDEEIAEASMMGAFTMLASTFINAQQIDHDQFREETLAIVSYVKKQMADAKNKKAAPSHAA
jgi:AhpD family alkylhydroperoxidase